MRDSIEEPLKILGAGVSGLSAAITLVRSGLDIEVFERSSYAGGRFKRDFQGLRNFGHSIADPFKEFEKLGIYLKPYKKLMRIIRHSRSHSFEVISDDKPIYYSVLRGENENSIDSQLASTAVDLGVNINFNTTLNSDEVNIVATGPPKRDSLAYGELYEDVNIDDSGYAFLNKKYSPSGYLYVIPGEKKGEAEVVNYTNDPTINMVTLKSFYNRALQDNVILKDLLDGATKNSTRGGIGCFSLLDEPYQDNRYYVGEAAGLQDFTAGFGIRYAIISGCLAAKSILTGDDYNQLITAAFNFHLEFEHKRSESFGLLTDKEIDKIFQDINEKFGHKLTIKEYESMRGEI